MASLLSQNIRWSNLGSACSFKPIKHTSRSSSKVLVRASTTSGPNEGSLTMTKRGLIASALLLGFAADVSGRKAHASQATEDITPIYFGNGCFWGRQKDFVDAEKELGRSPDQISAVTGYAGGTGGSEGPVCYYYGKKGTVYEDLGHAEVVQLDLSKDPKQARDEMEKFATTYFSQFKKTRGGMQRLDPQDAGPAYRNVIGIPGGVNSPLFKILQEKNVNKMELREGNGNQPGDLKEGDIVNVIHVLDSNAATFHKAEIYHQFHNGIGVPFGQDYTKKQKQIATRNNRIGPTGCPELSPFF